jgi:hypothetical protein
MAGRRFAEANERFTFERSNVESWEHFATKALNDVQPIPVLAYPKWISPWGTATDIDRIKRRVHFVFVVDSRFHHFFNC